MRKHFLPLLTTFVTTTAVAFTVGISYKTAQTTSNAQKVATEIPISTNRNAISPIRKMSDPIDSNAWQVGADTTPLRDRTGDFLRDSVRDPFYLPDPSVVEKSVEYDPKTNRYYVTEKIGGEFFRTPTALTFEEYAKWKAKQQEREHFDRLAGIGKGRKTNVVDPLTKIDFAQTQNNNLKLLLDQAGKLNPAEFSRSKNAGDWFIRQLIGDPPTVQINPQGTIDLTFGGDYHRYKNPILPIRAQTVGGLLFEMNINFNVTGKIGQKIDLNTAFNNRSSFDFDRIIKLNYNSQQFSEDAILQKIEGGNVSLPLRGTLIQGSQNLFGVKTELKFGYLRLTALAAQQQSRRQNLRIQGGAQVQNFSVQADQYDENKHFFLTHYNRNVYEKALERLPQIQSRFSIQEIEVWISNERNETNGEVRQVVALSDLGESERFNGTTVQPNQGWRTGNHQDILNNNQWLPGNDANDLWRKLEQQGDNVRRLDRVSSTLESGIFGLKSGTEFFKMSARKLAPNEYTYNQQLGTLSINNVDRGQVVGFAVRYLFNGSGPDPANPSVPYQIGEFSGDTPPYFSTDSTSRIMFVKMLKSVGHFPDIPMWDLMMKNVYSVNAFVQNSTDFRLDIFYQDALAKDRAEKRFLTEGGLNTQPLLRLLNLDRLNMQGDPQPDGQFDFIPGLTINTRTGRIMFPVLEPFGSSLRKKILELTNNDSTLANRYTYPELYTKTLFLAQERAEKNRFVIRGSAKSSVSSTISLGAFGLKPDAKITVTSGGRVLQQGIDYEVDYGIGTVRIINAAFLGPDVPLNVSYEDQTLFNFQQRTMLGLRADYDVNKDFQIGATYLNLFEQPFTQKVNTGEDPINNRVYGVDLRISKEAPWLTKMLDKLPFYSTKAPSQITLTAEAAYLDPGHARGINIGDEDRGTVYIDDFEGGTSQFNLMTAPQNWFLASVPQRHPEFPETQVRDNTTIWGANRALMNWYLQEDAIVQKSADPSGIYSRLFTQTEVFKNLTVNAQQGQINLLRPFDLSYYPEERGPYNFDRPNGYPNISYGLRRGNRLKNPEKRWGGIMRALQNTDFEAANFEYLDIWMLDPTLEDAQRDNSGKLLIHLGAISEDILNDSRRSYENGMPKNTTDNNIRTDSTKWGRVPRTEINLPRAFDASEEIRNFQDIGLDGLNDEGERNHFQGFLDSCRNAGILDDAMQNDPANDNFIYFNDDRYTNQTPSRDRYRRNNMPQGNSSGNATNIPQFTTNIPDNEDINFNNTFEENEGYYEYKLDITPSTGTEGLVPNDYYIEEVEGSQTKKKWYHYRIPLDKFRAKYGQIDGFRNIRFIRIIAKDFKNPITMRFARFDLVRNTWRRYRRDSLTRGGVNIDPFATDAQFDISSVNVEDNGGRQPFNYVLPRGIVRENAIASFAANAFQNEQSLSLRVCGLQPGRKKMAFKLSQIDMRLYERLKMFIHAEETSAKPVPDGKTSVFLRVGSDFEDNYYEYEIPLTISKPMPASTSDAYKDEVWRAENTFDFPLTLFTQLKEKRNALGISAGSIYAFSDPEKPNNTVRIVGNPSLGQVKGFMIGLKNNDNTDHCFEIWANELRASGIFEQGGGAALGRLDVKLADLGTFVASGNYQGIGYGSIENRVNQRSLEETVQYDLSTNLDLGKLLPEKSGIRVPFFTQYSNTTVTPKYDPYDLDLTLKSKIAAVGDDQQKDSIRSMAITRQTLRTVSFTNVRKERTNSAKKPMPWDIENFSATYAHTQSERSDPIISSDKKDAYRGGLDYVFAREVKYWQPFKPLIKKDKYLKFITDFNLNLLPNSVSVNNLLDRQVNTTVFRFAGEDPQYNTYFMRRFTWDRNYNMQWDLTRSLKINFDAKTQSVIDELNDFQANGAPVSQQEKQEYVLQNLQNFGRTKLYNQNLNINYTVPLRNIPFMDWVNLRATYAATYGWEASSRDLQLPDATSVPGTTLDPVGNAIKNSQNRQINADFNFENLYNYSKYLRKINTPLPETPRPEKKKRTRTGSTKDKMQELELPDMKETDPSKKEKAVSDETPSVVGKTKKSKKDKKEKSDEPSALERAILRPLMAVRKARINYTEQFNSFVPGFTPQAQLFGMNNLATPGWAYNLGWQTADRTWLDRIGGDGYISTNPLQNRAALNNYSQNIQANITVEPFRDFRIDIEANRQYTRNRTEEFRDTSLDGIKNLVHTAEKEAGTFTISYFTLNTMFSPLDEVFAQFKANRVEASRFLAPDAALHPDPIIGAKGYKVGYGPLQRDVLTTAFLAAYTGKTPNELNRNLFNTIPKLNWRLTYTGLNKLPFFRDIFQSFSLSHGYRSTLTVSQYSNELNYSTTSQRTIPQTYDYYAQYNIPTLVISEQFQPLLGIDARLKSDLSFNFNWQQSRNLALSVGDKKLVETKVVQITAGIGHRLKNVVIPFLTPKAQRAPKKKKGKEGDATNPTNQQGQPQNGQPQQPKRGNDLELKFDLSFRNDETANRELDQDNEILTRGSQTLRISPSARYTLNRSLDLRLFMDYDHIIPSTTASFPTYNFRGGLVVTFKLAR